MAAGSIPLWLVGALPAAAARPEEFESPEGFELPEGFESAAGSEPQAASAKRPRTATMPTSERIADPGMCSCLPKGPALREWVTTLSVPQWWTGCQSPARNRALLALAVANCGTPRSSVDAAYATDSLVIDTRGHEGTATQMLHLETLPPLPSV